MQTCLCGCFIVSLLFVLKCVFVVVVKSFLSIFSASFRTSYEAGLVVMNSLSICLSEKDLISPLLMKLSLARYKYMVGVSFFLFFF